MNKKNLKKQAIKKSKTSPIQLTDKEKDLIVEKRFQQLLKSPRLQKESSRQKVIKAYELAKEAHKNQVRKGGLKLPYISHPIAVALIISDEMGFGSTTIAAALLHDVVEDTEYTLEDLEASFGKEIASIVDGLTKITNVPGKGKTAQAATFQKLILKMSQDRRVAFLKIADRLHNLRTMADMSINSIMIKTAEALEIYAPLAFKLGLVKIRKEIEDICFKLREPGEYRRMESIVNHNTKRLGHDTRKFTEELSDMMQKNNYEYYIEPVRKSLFRLRNDMKKKKLSFDQIVNFQSERIIFKQRNDLTISQQCFDIYCMVSEKYKVRPDSLRDWVTNARSNGFQALVFEIFFNGYWKEIQVMTEAMNEIAQRGFAKNHENLHMRNIQTWVNATEKAISHNTLSNNELIDLISPEVTEIIVITPIGELISLSKNSTVLDFAFKVHTKLGLRFLSAEVNKKIVKPDYVLQNGDMVKIIDSDNAKPDISWLQYLTNTSNRIKLKEHLASKRNKKITVGKEIFKEIEQKYSLDLKDIDEIINELALKDKDELFYKLGTKSIIENDIKKLFKQNNNIFNVIKIKKPSQNEKTKKIILSDKKQPYVIRNLQDLFLAKCCNPIPGDESMIHINKNYEATIHKRSCQRAKKLNSSDGKNTRAAKWELTNQENVIATIEFRGLDRKGLLADILKITHDDLKINMNKLNITAEENTINGLIKFWISDTKVLDIVIKRISKLKGITEVRRK